MDFSGFKVGLMDFRPDGGDFRSDCKIFRPDSTDFLPDFKYNRYFRPNLRYFRSDFNDRMNLREYRDFRPDFRDFRSDNFRTFVDQISEVFNPSMLASH